MTAARTPAPWLTVVGMGDDGVDGLSPAARCALDDAEVVFGAKRHLERLGPVAAKTIAWRSPFVPSVGAVGRYRGRKAVVLATGDPMWYGVGRTLLRTLDAAELNVIPSPSVFSLAAARMGWMIEEVEPMSLHGRSLPRLIPLIQPGARILTLCLNGRTPSMVAELLTARGFGPSQLTALSNLASAAEQCVSHTANRWRAKIVPDLTTLAIECRAGAKAQYRSTAPGLPDDAFQHDGNITKRDVRAITLAALAPMPGAHLWDVGAGCGAVAIEWCRAAKSATASAIEVRPDRLASIGRNAQALGVPDLLIVAGKAPAAFKGLTPPDAIFVGGGASAADGANLIARAWRALKPGGRIVANAVTLEAETRLRTCFERHGGELVRIDIAHADALGALHGWRPQRPVTQWRGTKR